MNYKDKPIPYWKHKQWYKARNKEIVKDRDSGNTWPELEDKYGISRVYLRQIYDRIKEE